MSLPALLLAAGLALGSAQDEVAGTAAESGPSDSARVLQEDLRHDPGLAEALASRILRSGLAERISSAADEPQRLADIRRWIQENPDAAASVAAGLAQDDQQGEHRFETAVLRNADHRFQVDAGHVNASTYGRLRKGSRDSKLMGADADMSEEERREIIKTMFEGQGGMSNQVVTRAPGAGQAGAGPAGSGLAAGYYDRLSRLNLRGYSPQLMAIQSALNQRRAPGAPKLLETGKLDFETLIYPAFGMRYDLRNLETRLRYEQNLALARAAGLAGKYRPEQLLDPSVEAELRRRAADKPEPRRTARRLALERAADALRGFEAAAQGARDPKAITRGLLAALGSKQKEAARWITVASLEEELERLQAQEQFFSPELKDLIAGCPVPAEVRAAYQRRGEAFAARLGRLKAGTQDCLSQLESEAWATAVPAVEAALAENARLRQNLGRDLQDFAQAPYRLRSLYQPRPRWRALLEEAVAGYLPGTAWGRRLREQSRQRETMKDVFAKIANGDLDAAHAILASAAP